MAKIERLTAEQDRRLPTFRRQWLQYGISTERADREKAERAILAMRKRINVEQQPIFIWCDSPATSLLAIHYLKSNEFRKFAGFSGEQPGEQPGEKRRAR